MAYDLASEKYDDLWGNWPQWLMDLGLPEKQARSIVGMVYAKCGKDATRADWTFRRVKDSETVGVKNVVAYLLRDIEGAS